MRHCKEKKNLTICLVHEEQREQSSLTAADTCNISVWHRTCVSAFWKRKHWINKKEAKSQGCFLKTNKDKTLNRYIRRDDIQVKCSLKSTNCLLIICYVKDFLSKERRHNCFFLLFDIFFSKIEFPYLFNRQLILCHWEVLLSVYKLIKNRGIDFF